MKSKKTKIDLQAFCHTHNPKYFHAFDLDGRTCASDGAIFIRLERRVKMKKGKPPIKDIGQYFEECKNFAVNAPRPLPPLKVREAKAVCPSCSERRDGIVDEGCEACGGFGVIEITAGRPLDLGSGHISPRYHKLLLTLPDCEIFPDSGRTKPFPRAFYFTFAGGEGILMPLSGACDEESEIVN